MKMDNAEFELRRVHLENPHDGIVCLFHKLSYFCPICFEGQEEYFRAKPDELTILNLLYTPCLNCWMKHTKDEIEEFRKNELFLFVLLTRISPIC